MEFKKFGTNTDIKFSQATVEQANIIASLVVQLTQEICTRTHVQHFNIDLEGTIKRCAELLSAGHYAAIIGWLNNTPIAVSTISETYALYAGGKIGVIQEFYVAPEYRAAGVGAMLITQVKQYGQNHDWSCMELCTSPLPEFERTLSFYQQHGLNPVGGRKMRLNLSQ